LLKFFVSPALLPKRSDAPSVWDSIIQRLLLILLITAIKLSMKSTKVLFITTSRDKMADTTEKTGVGLEELAVPYYMFKEAGADITLASPGGGRVPLDPKSQSIILATFSTKRFLKDAEAMNLLSNAVQLEEVNDGDFDVIFLLWGNGGPNFIHEFRQWETEEQRSWSVVKASAHTNDRFLSGANAVPLGSANKAVQQPSPASRTAMDQFSFLRRRLLPLALNAQQPQWFSGVPRQLTWWNTPR
jgi:hypothetical protein